MMAAAQQDENGFVANRAKQCAEKTGEVVSAQARNYGLLAPVRGHFATAK